MIMKKIYKRPMVAVHEICMEQPIALASHPMAPVRAELKADATLKGHGSDFWQAPAVNGIIDDDDEDEW